MKNPRYSNYKRPHREKPKRAHKNQPKPVRKAGPGIFASVIDRLQPYVQCKYTGNDTAKTFHLTIVNPSTSTVVGADGKAADPRLFKHVDAPAFSLLYFIEKNVSRLPELKSEAMHGCIQHAADFYDKGIDFDITLWGHDGSIEYHEGLLDPAELMGKLIREAPSLVYPEWPYPADFLIRKEDPCALVAKGIEFSTICLPDCAHFADNQIEIAPQQCCVILNDDDNALPDGATLTCCYTEEWWGTSNILPRVYFKYAGIRDGWNHAFQALPVSGYRQGGIWMMAVPALQTMGDDQCLWLPVLKVDHTSWSMEIKGTLYWTDTEFAHVPNKDQCRQVTIDLVYAIEEFAYIGGKNKRRA